MGNVVSLVGEEHQAQLNGEPDKDIVSVLEELLVEAKSGRITGFAYVATDHLDWVITQQVAGKRYIIQGALNRLMHNINRMIDKEKQEN
jgi:hypothetical protein